MRLLLEGKETSLKLPVGLRVGRGQEILVAVWFLSQFSLSLWQAGRKTYAMVSGPSSGHSLASELVESHDGHEEIIKVSSVHFPFFFLLSPCRYGKELLADSADWKKGWNGGKLAPLISSHPKSRARSE